MICEQRQQGVGMGLRELHELVQALGKRIDTHGVELSQNEALTRYSLIDPLLSSDAVFTSKRLPPISRSHGMMRDSLL